VPILVAGLLSFEPAASPLAAANKGEQPMTSDEKVVLKEIIEMRREFSNAIHKLINLRNRNEGNDLDPFTCGDYDADELENLCEWLLEIAAASRRKWS
jgi:hypothetical protein